MSRMKQTKFSKMLKEARETLQWTKRDVANAINVSWLSIYFWERGRTYPNAENYIKLQKLFSIHGFFFNLEDKL
jgi:DNA-binding XRE family transcriptional regulator